MRRILVAVLVLSWVAPTFATGVEQDHCRRFEMGSRQIDKMNVHVKRLAGRGVIRNDVYACRDRGYIYAWGPTDRRLDADGSEQWHEAYCEIEKWLSGRWTCRTTELRTIKVSWPGVAPDPVEIYIPPKANGRLARQRVDQAIPLISRLDKQSACTVGESTPQELLELRGDLVAPWLQLAIEGERFTLWTQRYAVHFTVGEGDGAQVRCWRRKKSDHECLSARCPA